MEEEDENVYSRVIHKVYDDEKAKRQLNSYRYKSYSQDKEKVWTPGRNNLERFKKKREREEKYLTHFHPEDKPVLLVKEKHKYKGFEKIPKEKFDKESFFKVSENTYPVDDISSEIAQLEDFIKRNTVIHKSKRRASSIEDLNPLFKVEGKEFLPSGFIELDPLLMKNEYVFDSKINEKMFDDAQRRIKMLRRKQYELRNTKKVRDVTIFVMDEQKNQVIQFLKKWNEKNQRKMNSEEVNYVSSLLGIAPKDILKIQELYFKKLEIIKEKKNREEINKIRFKDLPFIDREDFSRSHNDIDSRYMRENKPFMPQYLGKYRRSPQ